MGTFTNEFEQRLDAQLKFIEQLRDSVTKAFAARSALGDSYSQVIAKAREINMFDPRKGEANPKGFISLASSAPVEVRQALAVKGPVDGVAKPIMKNLPNLGLGKEESLAAAITCVLEDSERSFANLSSAKLPVEDQLLVILAALKNHPVLNYEEFKTQEVIYQTANTDDPHEMQELQRRFEQVRGKKTQHIRKHVLHYITEEIKQQPNYRIVLLRASMKRDTFGTLETLRESASASEKDLKSNTTNLLDGVSVEDKLDLVEFAANFGMGLASTYLDLFAIPPDPEWHPRLQKIFQRDVTAGQSLFGVYAFEGAQNYPFNLGRIEPTLPRRITNSEALDYLNRGDSSGEGENTKQRTHSANEIAETVAMLQDKDVKRFLEALKWGISHNWKSYVQDRKRDIIFGDYTLKVRDIIFLVAYSLFEPEEKFEEIFTMVEKNHPLLSEEIENIYVLANRYYFFDVLGINPTFLFNRSKKANGSFGTLIEDVSEYQVHNLLHICMSIFIRAGDVIFRDMSIAWNMLIGQCEGKMDSVFHEISMLFDTFDTLLNIIGNGIPDLQAWIMTVIDAVSQDAPNLPVVIIETPKETHLRITTKAMIGRVRDLLNKYCLDALYFKAKLDGSSPISIIQTLKIPRSKTDKLRTLLSKSEQDKEK